MRVRVCVCVCARARRVGVGKWECELMTEAVLIKPLDMYMATSW